MSKTKRILTDAGLEDTYWGKAIIQAQEDGAFTPELSEESGNWTTCACGKQSDMIPRQPDGGAPVDSILLKLGVLFCDFVGDNAFTRSAETLVKIEERATEVLKEVYSEVSDVNS